jgi:hypothetical protein
MKSSLHSLIPFLPFLVNYFASCKLWRLDSILIPATWDPRYIASGQTHRKQRFLCCCVLICCCRDVFTTQLCGNEGGVDPKRTPIAAPLLLLCDTFLCCMCTGHYLAMAVSLLPQFLLWANMPQYTSMDRYQSLDLKMGAAHSSETLVPTS